MALKTPNHTQLSNDYIDNWMALLSPAATLVFLAITRKTVGWHKDSDPVSLAQLQQMTGLSKQGVINGIRQLEENELVVAERSENRATVYSVDYGCQLNGQGSQLSRQQGSQLSRHTKETLKETRTKESINVELEANVDTVLQSIIDTTGRRYKLKSEIHRRPIRSRLKDGATVEECLLIIKAKWEQWQDDERMREYVRPSTLFRPSHFEEYLAFARESETNEEKKREERRKADAEYAEIWNRAGRR